MLGAGWLLDAVQSLVLSSLMAFARRRRHAGGLHCAERGTATGSAWVAVSGVTFMLVALGGLSWIALDRRGVPWPVHAASAIAGMAYLASMAAALWARYSYLIELREVVAHGPSYDPVTRMRSHAETGQMVGLAFLRQHDDGPAAWA